MFLYSSHASQNSKFSSLNSVCRKERKAATPSEQGGEDAVAFVRGAHAIRHPGFSGTATLQDKIDKKGGRVLLLLHQGPS